MAVSPRRHTRHLQPAVQAVIQKHHNPTPWSSNMNRTKTILGTIGLAASLSVGTAEAQDTGLFDWDSYEDDYDDYETSSDSITDAETSFKGAVMLKGDIDVSFAEVTAGVIEDDENYRYAFFSGNTLYAGVEDRNGNTTDMIVEFFWFESSIDRGSDFWVAVVKARTSPNLEDDWALEVEDSPVLSLHAETYNDMDNSGFRWDWSLPFESYGWDSYGSVTMESSYGLNTNAEGAAMVAYEFEENEDGVRTEAEATVQAKGYMNDSFQIQTKYQITLWRWEMMVHGTPADMDWDLYLDSWDRMDQNAYHEFMIVMQADEGKGFNLERLELSGTANYPRWYWWDSASTMSIALTDIEISRPEIDMSDYEGNNDGQNSDNGNSDVPNESDDGEIENEISDEAGDETNPTTTNNITVETPAAASGCSTTGNRTAPLGLALALGLVAMGRRKDD